MHEKDLMPPPMFGESFKAGNNSRGEDATPPRIEDTDEYGDPIVKPNSNEAEEDQDNDKPSITELMKNPSKVVLCKVESNFKSLTFESAKRLLRF